MRQPAPMSATSKPTRSRSANQFRFGSGVLTKRSGCGPHSLAMRLAVCTSAARSGHETFFAQGAFKFAVGRRGQHLAGDVERRLRLAALVVLSDPTLPRLVLLDVDVSESDAQLAQMLERVLCVRAPIRTVNFHFHARNDSRGNDERGTMNEKQLACHSSFINHHFFA